MENCCRYESPGFRYRRHAIGALAGFLTFLVADRSSAQTFDVSVPLPAAVDFRDVVLAANGNLRVEASSSVEGGAHSEIVNMGNLLTGISAGAKTGDVYSVAGVTVELAQITGNIKTEGLVVRAPFSTVTGTVSQLTSIGRSTGPKLHVEFPAATNGARNVLPLQTMALAPGRYSALNVSPGGTLTLNSGAYYFDAYVLDPLSTVVVDESAGPVQIYVTTTLQHMGKYKRPDGTPPNLLVGFFGIVPAYIGASFPGTVIAPNAQLVIGTQLGGTTHVGAFFGQGIEVLPFTSIKHRPTNFFGIGNGNAIFATPTKQPILDVSGAVVPVSDPVRPPPMTAVFHDSSEGGYYDTVRQLPANPTTGVVPQQFCTANNQPLGTLTDTQLNAAPTPGATCPAFGGTPTQCPVDPDSLTNTCATDSDCAPGLICASGCLDDACTVIDSRCGRQAISCGGLPAEANCDEQYICPEEGAIGTVNQAEVAASLAPVTAPDPLGAITQPSEKTQLSSTYQAITAFDNASGVICIGPTYDPVTKHDGVSKPHLNGKGKWGFFSRPVFDYSTKMTKSPNAIGELLMNVRASYSVGGTVYGTDIELVGANLHGVVDDCGVTAYADLKLLGETVASFSRQDGLSLKLPINDKQELATPDNNRRECVNSREALKNSYLEVRKSYLFARSVQDFYKYKGGLTNELCQSIVDGVKKTLINPTTQKPWNCKVDKPTGAGGISILNAWKDEFESVSANYYPFAAQLKTAQSAVSTEVDVKSFLKEASHPLHQKIFNRTFMLGWFPLNVAIEAFGGFGLSGVWKLGLGIDGNFDSAKKIVGNALKGKAPVFGDLRAYTGPEVTPYAEFNILAFVGVGFRALSVGIDGTILIIRESLPIGLVATAMRLAVNDTRTATNGDWNGTPIPNLGSKNYQWVQGASWGAQYELEALTGHLYLAARVKFRFFKRTYKLKVFEWTGYKAKFPLVGGGIADGRLNPQDDLGVQGEQFPYNTIIPFGNSDLPLNAGGAAAGAAFPNCAPVQGL